MASVADKIKLIVEWSPLIGLIQAIPVAPDPRSKTVAVVNLLEFCANKTPVAFDEELLALIEAILLTAEGGMLIDWCAKIGNLVLLSEMTDGTPTDEST